METKGEEILPGKAECVGSLRNVLDAQYALNGKWKVALILCMIQSPRRFNEILQEIPGLSSKVLANELKHLELNDFVRRVVDPKIPANIIYEATEYSKGLKSLINELSAWGEKHREKIRRSMKQ
jgi:DNA-binding HxlR family transcriptional regulator